jgi:hypothetical protein
MYDNKHDASMRLMKTIIRYDNQPVFVHDVLENADFDLYLSVEFLLKNDKKKRDIVPLALKDDKWCFASPMLGYVQESPVSVVYVYRKPSRRQAQGVDPRRLMAKVPGMPDQTCGHINYTRLAKCIADVYPSLEKYTTMCKEYGPASWSLAISKCFALSWDKLYYRAKPIASISHSNGWEHTLTVDNTMFLSYKFEEVFNAENWRIG